MILATLVSAGPAITGRKIPTRLIPQQDLSRSDINARKELTFKGNILPGPVQFFVNGLRFSPDMPPIKSTVGTIEEWTVQNEDVFKHPIHIHVNPFQVIEIDGRKVERPIWWDTFMLPPKHVVDGQEVPGRIKIRMRFRSDISGKTVFHCHFLPHEDNGMMSVFELIRPNE